MEFSKLERAKARELLKKAVEIEFAMGLQKFAKILEDWKDRKTDTRKSYYAIFQEIKDFDKHIAWRYDGVKNNDLEFIIIQLFNENIITNKDLEVFRPEIQESLRKKMLFD
jgi:hypothetical protein